MAATLEVLTSRGAGRRNRRWPDEVKGRIVAETLRPGRTVNDVAREHGLKANHVSAWRTLARKGKLVLPAPEEAVEFVAMVLAPPEGEAPVVGRAGPEILVGAVTIRLEPGASAERIAAIVRALAPPA